MNGGGARGPQAFSKKNRLLIAADFDRVFKQGRRVHVPELTLAFRKRPSREDQLIAPRLGLSVSRKVGNAVKRNQVKRRIREFFRKNKDIFANGSEFVLVPKKEVTKLSSNGLNRSIMDLFDRSKLIEPKK